MQEEIRAVALPEEVRAADGVLSPASSSSAKWPADQFEYKTKDTARLAGVEWHTLTAQETGRDRLKDLGCQTQNGLSVRVLMTLLIYAKALAYFRGNRVVDLEDVRQILPFVLHDKLMPDRDAPFFEAPGTPRSAPIASAGCASCSICPARNTTG